MSNTTSSLPMEDLLALFRSTPDLVCIADRQGYLRNFNPAVGATLGYTDDELFKIPIADFIHPDDREPTASRRARLLKGETLLNFSNRYIAKTGDVIWLEWTSVFLPERELVLAIAKNITLRKQLEQKIEEEFASLKRQAVHFKSKLEKERKVVAAELHEEIAQLASAIRLDVDWLSANVQSSDKSVDVRIEHARITSDLLVDTIRRISFSISPAMLDDLGLDATLEWYCSEFSSTTGIDCSYESTFEESSLTNETRLDFFRICQEVLNNIKDSQISKVDISVKKIAMKVVLSIAYNDKVYQLNNTQQSNIRERVSSFGGRCTIDGNNIVVEAQIKN